jgi:drug/metabolite transporter (DMT)-like permease
LQFGNCQQRPLALKSSFLYSAILAATANLFWAANAIVGKAVVATLPAFTLSQFRWMLAFFILAPIGLPKIRQQWPWYRENVFRLALLSLLSVGLYNTLQYWSLEHTEPVKVGAMLALMPIAISVVSGFFGGRRQTPVEWLTTAIAVFGALIVVTNGEFSVLLGQSQSGKGELLMATAVISWAFYSVLLKKTPHDSISMIGLLTFFLGVGTVLILPFWFVDILTEPVFVPSGSLWWSVLFVAVFPSIVSYLCWNNAIRLGDATIAGLMVTLAPLFNALLSIVFLDQVVSGIQWLGISIVMIGVTATLLLSKWLTRN